MYEYFRVRELFPHCANYEINECVTRGYIDSLLILLMVLDAFRAEIESPIAITSGYRDKFHNSRVGGSVSSQHLLGEAIDFITPKLDNNSTIKRLRTFLKDSALRKYIGQVIFYDEFIHIALSTEKHKIPTFYDKRKCKKSN